MRMIFNLLAARAPATEAFPATDESMLSSTASLVCPAHGSSTAREAVDIRSSQK